MYNMYMMKSMNHNSLSCEEQINIDGRENEITHCAACTMYNDMIWNENFQVCSFTWILSTGRELPGVAMSAARGDSSLSLCSAG